MSVCDHEEQCAFTQQGQQSTSTRWLQGPVGSLAVCHQAGDILIIVTLSCCSAVGGLGLS